MWPHGRVHVQTGASFYQLAYAVDVDPQTGSFVLPLYRTGDRELSPLATFTAGGGLRLSLTAPEAKTQLGLIVQGDAMYSRYFNLLFITNRAAIYGSVGLDAEFE